MNLVDEFIEQELAKNLSPILQQIQNCHSAVEELIITLEHRRTSPKLELLDHKIERVSAFLSTKEQILSLLEKGAHNPILEWLANERIDSPLLIELIHHEQQHLHSLIQSSVERVFLKDQSIEEHLEQNRMLEDCLFLLSAVRDDLTSNRTPSRDKLKNVDAKETTIGDRIALFGKNVAQLKREIDDIVEQLYQFEKTVAMQFRMCIGSKRQTGSQETPMFAQQSRSQQSKWKNTNEGFSKTNSELGQKNRHEQRLFRPERTEGWGQREVKQNEPSHLGLSSRVQISNMRPETAPNAFWKRQQQSQMRMQSAFQF